MHKFITLDGRIEYSDNFMNGPHTNGVWYNISRLEDNFTTWKEGYGVESVDPNVNYIFGYEETEFMNKQYKKV